MLFVSFFLREASQLSVYGCGRHKCLFSYTKISFFFFFPIYNDFMLQHFSCSLLPVCYDSIIFKKIAVVLIRNIFSMAFQKVIDKITSGQHLLLI